MSHNSKNATRHAKAKDVAAMHARGEKGPAKTNPLHNKKWGYRTNPEVQKRIAEQLKATQAPVPGEGKSAGKAILRKAGKASAEVVTA